MIEDFISGVIVTIAVPAALYYMLHKRYGTTIEIQWRGNRKQYYPRKKKPSSKNDSNKQEKPIEIHLKIDKEGKVEAETKP